MNDKYITDTFIEERLKEFDNQLRLLRIMHGRNEMKGGWVSYEDNRSSLLQALQDAIKYGEERQIRKQYPSQHKYNQTPNRKLQQKHKYHKKINKSFGDCDLCLLEDKEEKE